MDKFQLLMILGLLLSAGCTTPYGPGGQIGGSDFIKAGCTLENNSMELNCSKAGGAAELSSCSRLILANITGLRGQIAECWSIGEETGILEKGCMLRQSATYVVPVYYVTNCGKMANCAGGDTGGWGLQRLATKKDFISYFGYPQNSSQAQAYALALGGSQADYSTSIPAGFRKYAEKEPTTVKEVQDGYTVNLFESQFCGCGPHPYYEITYSVNKTGEVGEISRRKVYENPELDGLCVD